MEVLNFYIALSTPLPPASSEEHQILHCEPYNDSVVSSLPVEMLGEIFQLAVEEDLGLAECDVLDVKHSPNWVISHVCRAWRSVALSMPNLWTSVCIEDQSDLLMLDDVPFTDNKATLLQEYLAHSGQYPLRVTLSSSYDIRKHLEILLPHFDRCTDLSFTIDKEALVTLSTISGEFPTLERLTITLDDISHYPGLPINFSSTTPQIDGFCKAPNLRVVSLYGISILYQKLPFSQLQSFTGDISNFVEYLELFFLASQLTTATLNVRWSHPPFTLPVPFSHTRLHTLSLYTDIRCMRDLRLPALEVFRIEHISSNGGYHHIAQVFQDSHCPLRCLYLEIPALRWSKLEPILKACSSTLTSLSIRIDTSSAWYVFNAFTLDGPSRIVPRLEELCIRDDMRPLWPEEYAEVSFADDVFLDMVFWRRDSDGDVAVLQSLTMCAPYAPRPDGTLKELQELEESGLKVEFHGYPWTKVI
ncbi:hypothetical protein IW261DRAFT_1511530 [Armillaria novae-zelandiae]|uniref:F-box domain-containing protein n=1 Tax=Armillaria novae-zelandiae TaxID=153914 RepID=A0AA39NTJ9_9AGAR|nr:hypothetical protein IW261DRAFT_1511530 [Armillaria novae-zelandiae]